MIIGDYIAINRKYTSSGIGGVAAKTLQDKGASKIQKALAASALAQTGTSKQTGAAMETKASKALSSDRSADLTKTLAATVLAQSNKKR